MFTVDAVHPSLPLHYTAVLWIRIRVQEGKKYPEKYKRVNKFNLFKCWMFSFEG
jgi:hypothetical protein